jgi:hypothetical protein
MRKTFIAQALAAEALVSRTYVMSAEEEAIVVAEAEQNITEATSELSDAERMLGVADGMDDLAVIAGNIQEATPTEAALIENAASQAVAGTGLESTELVPAAESFVGKRIAAEDFRQKAKSIFENVQKTLDGIWAKIIAWFKEYFGQLNRTRVFLEKVIEGVKETAKENQEIKNKDFSVTAKAILTVNGSCVKNIGEFTAALGTFGDLTGNLTKAASTIAAYGDDIADGMNKFTAADGNSAAEHILESAEKTFKDYKTISGVALVGRKGSQVVNGMDERYSVPLLGNTQVVARAPAGAKQGTIHHQLECRRQTTILLLKTEENATVDKVTFQTPTLDQTVTMLEKALELITDVQKFDASSEMKKMLDCRNKIKTAAAKVTKALSEIKDTDTGGDAAVSLGRSIINLSFSYANMVGQSQSVVVAGPRLATQAGNAAIWLAGSVLSNYSKPAPAEAAK